jgi:hypothetical protein
MDEQERARLIADMRWVVEQAEYVIRLTNLNRYDSDSEDGILRELGKLRRQVNENDFRANRAVNAQRAGA